MVAVHSARKIRSYVGLSSSIFAGERLKAMIYSPRLFVNAATGAMGLTRSLRNSRNIGAMGLESATLAHLNRFCIDLCLGVVLLSGNLYAFNKPTLAAETNRG